MLAYNVDLLLLPPDSGLQTQFYCTFAFKSRMAIGGYDYYLLCCPLLLIALCLAFHFDLLSRWRNKMTMLQGKPYLAAMPLGSMIITQYEKQGTCSTRLRACSAHAHAHAHAHARARAHAHARARAHARAMHMHMHVPCAHLGERDVLAHLQLDQVLLAVDDLHVARRRDLADVAGAEVPHAWSRLEAE